MRLRRREVVAVGGDGRECDPHSRDARLATDLHVRVQRAVEVLHRLVPRPGLQVDDAKVGAGDGDVGEVAEAGGDFHGAQEVPGGLPPIGEMAVEHAEIVVGANHALFVVEIPAEEVERGLVELLRLVQIAETEMDPAVAVVRVGERRRSVFSL